MDPLNKNTAPLSDPNTLPWASGPVASRPNPLPPPVNPAPVSPLPAPVNFHTPPPNLPVQEPPKPHPGNFQEKSFSASTVSVNPPPPPQNPADGQPPRASAEAKGHSDFPVPDKKFPLLFATFLVIMTVTGFSGSYLYFRYTGQAAKRQTIVPPVTPPVKLPRVSPDPSLQDKNGTASSELNNPFQTAYVNPFSDEAGYENPFGSDESDISDTPYQNPFENLE